MILSRIIDSTKERVAQCKKQLPLHTLREQAEALHKAKPHTRSFENALRTKGLSAICEIKRLRHQRALSMLASPTLTSLKDMKTLGQMPSPASQSRTTS